MKKLRQFLLAALMMLSIGLIPTTPFAVIAAADAQLDEGDENKTIDQYTPRVEVIQKRMLQRLKTIDQLKYKGILGENKLGYLAPTPRFEKSLDEKQLALVKEENQDRKEIYTILAKRTNTTLLQVQDIRAKMVREKSKKGYWLQDTKGRWYQKR